MRVLVVSAVRLLGEALVASLPDGQDIAVETALDLGALRTRLLAGGVDLVLVDVAFPFDFEEMRLLAAAWPELPILALGLAERREEVIRHGRAGFAGYVPRDASLAEVRATLREATAGRLRCPAEIAGGLMRALFRPSEPRPAAAAAALTGRETQVLHLLGRGFSNKEIARELALSVATVKHHVHGVLGKLGVGRRAQAMRRVREAPWIGD